MILYVFWLALAVVPAVIAQVATCTNNNFNWAYNSLGQGPCEVAMDLTQPCPPGYTFGPLSPGQLYTPAQPNNCTCNTIRYSLISVCAACQDGSWLPFSNYTQACTYRFVQQYPETVPSDTSVPGWAYLPLSGAGTFDIAVASSAAASSSTASPTSTSASQATSTSPSSPKSSSSSTSSSPLSSSPSSSSSASGPSSSSSSSSSSSTSGSPKTAKNDTAAIAGGTVAGVLGGALIGGLLFWFWLYKKRKGEQHNVQLWSGRGILATPSLSSSPASAQRLFQAQKLYNPDDPTTYPPTRDQLTQMNLLPTRTSTESPRGPYFPGRPEV